MLRQFVSAVALSIGVVAAAPALAQAPAATADATAAIKPGAKVLDPQGGDVGTIASVSGQVAVVDTGTHKVGLAFGSFAMRPAGLTIGLTKAALDDTAAQQQAQTIASITAGAKVSGAQGAAIGTIETVDAQGAVVDTGKAKVKLPLTAFAKGPDGLVIGMTAAQLEAAASPGAPAQP